MACNSKQKLLEDIECEGFHYTFHGYDDYSGIQDPIFQKLYKEYIEATKKLADHLGVEYL
jgi:hypothetical protein